MKPQSSNFNHQPAPANPAPERGHSCPQQRATSQGAESLPKSPLKFGAWSLLEVWSSKFEVSSILFLLLAAGPILHTLVLVFSSRFPAAHDGFQYFTLQWYFLNNAAQSGEWAQWMPFATEGAVANYWWGLQASFLQNALMSCGKLLRGWNLLDLSYWGLCVDELILLTGCWLLCQRFIRSPLARAYACVCVLGSSLWLDQVHWNFHLYYAVPLVLHFGHRFLETAKWRYVFLASNLLAAQTLGNIPYFLPVTSFVITAYFAFYIAFNWSEVADPWRAAFSSIRSSRRKEALISRAQAIHDRSIAKTRPTILPLPRRGGEGWGEGELRGLWSVVRGLWSAPLALALSAFSFWAAYKYLTIGTDQLANFYPGRSPELQTDLATFLSWGGKLKLRHWTEMLLGITPWLDFSLYTGILTVPFAIIGAAVTGRCRLHLLFLTVVIALFAHGTFVAAALFHLWPMMHYFRHLSLVSPFVRLFLCFIAGLGFDWLLAHSSSPARHSFSEGGSSPARRSLGEGGSSSSNSSPSTHDPRPSPAGPSHLAPDTRHLTHGPSSTIHHPSSAPLRTIVTVALGLFLLVLSFYLFSLANPSGASSCLQWLSVNPDLGSAEHPLSLPETISRLHRTGVMAALSGILLLLTGVARQSWHIIHHPSSTIYHPSSPSSPSSSPPPISTTTNSFIYSRAPTLAAGTPPTSPPPVPLLSSHAASPACPRNSRAWPSWLPSAASAPCNIPPSTALSSWTKPPTPTHALTIGCVPSTNSSAPVPANPWKAIPNAPAAA